MFVCMNVLCMADRKYNKKSITKHTSGMVCWLSHATMDLKVPGVNLTD